jgi:L-ascorbate metabolism protein UlaG (beta-lactamase superfamily)
VPADAIRDVDGVLISHLHWDHLDFPSLRRLRSALPVLVPRGGGSLLERRGLCRVVEVEEGQEVEIDGLTVLATHAEHAGGRGPFRASSRALGYVLSGSTRAYFAGDTNLFPGMASLARSLDVALLPVAGWGPRVETGHLDPQRAAEALRLLKPRVAVPIHWGTYVAGWARPDRDELHAPVVAFAAHAQELAPTVEVRILEPGESTDV